VFSTGDGLDHYRRLLSDAADHLARDGRLIIQFDGDVLEARREELPLLRTQLESMLAAA
jgi:methylase of polypeptide subunit release factors